MSDESLGDGRTRRMLEYAISQAVDGKTVMVYAHSVHYSRELMRRCHRMVLAKLDNADDEDITRLAPPIGKALGINDGRIVFDAITKLNFRWTTMRGRGILRGTVQLVDHYAIENKLQALIGRLDRFLGASNE